MGWWGEMLAAWSLCFWRCKRGEVWFQHQPRTEEGNWTLPGDRLQLCGMPINVSLEGSGFSVCLLGFFLVPFDWGLPVYLQWNRNSFITSPFLLIFAYRVAKANSIHKSSNQGFPGDSVVRSLPANEGGRGLIPGVGGSHMSRDNGTRSAAAIEVHWPGACTPQQEKPLQWEAGAQQLETASSSQREEACAQQWRCCTAWNWWINKYILNKIVVSLYWVLAVASSLLIIKHMTSLSPLTSLRNSVWLIPF